MLIVLSSLVLQLSLYPQKIQFLSHNKFLFSLVFVLISILRLNTELSTVILVYLFFVPSVFKSCSLCAQQSSFTAEPIPKKTQVSELDNNFLFCSLVFCIDKHVLDSLQINQDVESMDTRLGICCKIIWAI